MIDDPKTPSLEADLHSYREIAAQAFRAHRPEGLAEPQPYDDVFDATEEQRDRAEVPLATDTGVESDPSKP